MRYFVTTALALCLSASALAAVPAVAEEISAAVAPGADSEGNRVVTYKADYFDQFQVSTALDMVFHVPGFSFNGGDNARGFAGTAGNVIIDGQRPVSKNNLSETLNTISSAQVDHVELIIGGAPGIDMMGHRQIVNVVRKQNGKPSINFGGNYKTFYHDGKPAGFFSYSKNKDGISTDFYMEAFGFHDNGTNDTKRYIYKTDFSDAVPDYVFIPQLAGGTGHQEKLTHSRPFLGGKLSFNGNYNPINYDLDAAYIQDGKTSPEHMDLKEIASEMGVQYERPLTKTLKMDLNYLRRYDRLSIYDVYHGDETSVYSSLAQSAEHIVSGKLTWQPSDKLTYKFGAESAFNSRDNTTRYIQGDTEQNVPSDVVRVEEARNEYYAIRNWQATKQLNIEAGLRVETSTISVKQEDRSKSFVYPKPMVQVVWAPREKVKLSWRTERVVGQLNFDDFASSVSLDTSVVKAGNPDIVPQKEWQNGITLDYSFWDKGSVTLGFKHATLEDTLDYKPIVTDDGVFNARGNIGEGTRDETTVNFTLPLDRFKVKGGEFKVEYTRYKTSVTDPVTGRTRAISDINPDVYVINFSQNLTKHRTSWGVEIDSLNNKEQFNATDYYHFKSASWIALWAEYKTKNNITFGMVFQNPFWRRDEYQRIVWEGQRDMSPQQEAQYNVAYGRPFVILRVKKEL
ncbi:MAG: outer membrane beta-barrel protein [Asticcacaulis sp.]|nr:outer membrane beta-barrel protein [Asticcacaulis sp.]